MNLEFYRNFIAMVEAGGMNRASRESMWPSRR